ncbi:MAG TPA: radical SAM protein [Pyrinomonadaceae bacterium]|nr:radical SAM protein [Pyrinomonadaceae bacterium]
MWLTPSFDLIVRTGFSDSSDASSTWISTQLNVRSANRYRLGTSFAVAAPEISTGTAPFIVLMDDMVVLSGEVLRSVFDFIVSTPECAGVTLSSTAVGPIFGDPSPGEELAPLTALPSWFSIIRRSAISESCCAGWKTPEFFLFDVAAHSTASTLFLRLGGGELHLNKENWVRDLLRHSSILLADDFEHFQQRHRESLTLIPPQFHIHAIGRYTETPPLPPSKKTKRNYPKFSLICPVFKPEFLREMIESVKRQSWQNWELQMLVDGPPEPSLSKIQAVLREHANDPRIKYSMQPNRGTGPTRDSLASAATGDFIFSLDDDDELTPDALEAFASAIIHNPGVPFFRGGTRLVGLVNRNVSPRPRLVIAGITNDIFEVTQPFVIAREALRVLGGFKWDTFLRNAGEDTLLFQKIDRLQMETRIIDRVLYHRRLSTSNLTLELKPEEAIGHALNLERLSRPAEWTTINCTEELSDGFQRAVSTHRRADGREVVCSTQYFQYRTLGTIEETTIDIELTSACNAVCTFCPREVMPDRTLYLPVEFVEALARHLDSAKRKPNVVFCGIGESTMHPELEKITRIVASTGTLVSMTTNGARMTTDFFRRLTAAGMTAFNFSLNATTAETHRKMMKFKAFDKINQVLDEILFLRRTTHNRTIVNVSFVVCEENEHEVDHFVNYWRPRGVSQIWLHPVNNRAGLLTEAARPVDLEKYVHKYMYDPLVVVDVLPKQNAGDDICKVARSFIFISAEGEMRLCAMDYRRETHYGNIGAVSLQSAHNKKLLAFLSGETRSICESCDFFPESCRQTVGNNGTKFLPILGQMAATR